MATQVLQNLATRLETIVEYSGRIAAWMTLLLVAVIFCVVLLRYGFSFGRIWFQEIGFYLHAFIFMIGIAYTLKHDSHVRVDIFYRRFSTRGKALVDLLGSLILLVPVCVFIIYISWADVTESWLTLEVSHRTDGLPFAYLLKTSLILMPLLLLLQGIAMILRCLVTLRQPGPAETGNG